MVGWREKTKEGLHSPDMHAQHTTSSDTTSSNLSLTTTSLLSTWDRSSEISLVNSSISLSLPSSIPWTVSKSSCNLAYKIREINTHMIQSVHAEQRESKHHICWFSIHSGSFKREYLIAVGFHHQRTPPFIELAALGTFIAVALAGATLNEVETPRSLKVPLYQPTSGWGKLWTHIFWRMEVFSEDKTKKKQQHQSNIHIWIHQSGSKMNRNNIAYVCMCVFMIYIRYACMYMSMCKHIYIHTYPYAHKHILHTYTTKSCTQ